MARRFFYVCVAILCLVAAYQLGVERASAEWDGTAPGQILGGGFAEGGPWIAFTSSGEAWSVTPAVGWFRRPEFDLPVSASGVKFLDSNGDIFVLVSTDDVAWMCDDGVGWFQIGPFPGGPMNVGGNIEPSSFGAIKGQYRDK